jgi:hypothetical protein
MFFDFEVREFIPNFFRQPVISLPPAGKDEGEGEVSLSCPPPPSPSPVEGGGELIEENFKYVWIIFNYSL